MNTYKYTLDKTSKKHICPSCHKKTFVKYIDTKTNEYLSDEFGRCDRESKCQYHSSPKGNTLQSNVIHDVSQVVLHPEPSCHSTDVLSYYGRNHPNNHFVIFLQQFFVPVDIKQAICKYFIGTSSHWNGATIFWQVDEYMNVCAGKVMLYDKNTGKRIKKPYPHINWMHKVLHKEDFVLQQCLFGIHNLYDYENGGTVCIVESEKTAVIMSIVFPGYLWLATGSKSNLKEQLLKPLKKYSIILFPDKTEFKDWSSKVNGFKNSGFNISCSDLLENKNLEEGGDLVDFILNQKNF